MPAEVPGINKLGVLDSLTHHESPPKHPPILHAPYCEHCSFKATLEYIVFSSDIALPLPTMSFQTPPPATTIFELSFPSPGVLLATINRENRMNSIPLRGHHEGTALWNWLDNEPSMRVGIITGKGSKAFCAGADLIEQRDISRGDEARPEKGAEGGFRRERHQQSDDRGSRLSA